MEHHDIDTVLGWRGKTAHAPDGTKLGKVAELLLGPEGDRPQYAELHTGLLGRHHTVVPLHGARIEDGDLVLPIGHGLLDEAPEVPEGPQVHADAAQRLRDHFGSAPVTAEGPDEVVRREEEVRVGPGEMEPVERVRVKKVLVTDEETRIVPVRREVVALETEPPEGAIESSEPLSPDDPRRAGDTRDLDGPPPAA